MNLTPQQKATAKRTGKRISFFNEQSGRQPPQPLEVPYYSLGTQVQEPTQSDGETLSGSEAPRYLSSVIFSPEKGDRARGHYQQTVPMKWGIPEQGNANWPQGGVAGVWGQNYSVYMGNNLDMNVPGYGSQVYSKLGQEPQQQPKRGQEKPTQNPASEAYRETALSRNVEWEQQQQALARQQAQIQAFRHGQKQGAAPPQPAVVLQPFQLAFGQQKQQLPPGYFQVFRPKRTVSNMGFGGQPTTQHQLQQQQEQIMQQQQLQQQQNQQIMESFYQNHLQQQQQQQQQLSQSLGSQSHQQGPPGHFQQSSLNPELQMYLGGSQQTELSAHHHPQPRRSRRLSKESAPPSAASQGEQPGNLFLIPWSKPAPGSQAPSTAAAAQNGALEAKVAARTEDATGTLTGVIQSTRRKRRVSQEVNLHTLAQKASEMDSIPPPAVKGAEEKAPAEGDSVSAKRPREESLVPLVIPVSVPVKRVDWLSLGREQAEREGWNQRAGPQDRAPLEQKASVIVTRRRSLRNSLSESTNQDEEGTNEEEAKACAKSKRRPRPEPLFIPPPKEGTFIPPPVYSTITPYQSHLRSPVRLADNPFSLPPYTPPPILSPVREGSGLYFSTIRSSATSNSLPAPTPATPKSVTRSLLRSNSSEITPPVLPLMGDATPVSIEPRINIGHRYQAEIPELRERLQTQQDEHKADLVWKPLQELQTKQSHQDTMRSLMNLACSSALCGGGTNQELALHCLHESRGDILVRTKTVVQCVEFYYTYKKQVKIGRNGTLIFGDSDILDGRETQDDAEINVKSSQRYGPTSREAPRQEEEVNSKQWEDPVNSMQDSALARVTHTLPANENASEVLVLRSQEVQSVEKKKEPPPRTRLPPPPPKPRRELPPTDKRKTGAVNQVQVQDQDSIFPCKKCGRVFYKVKSRSAHMKSHSEQEKKAAALRQKMVEEEEKAAVARAEAAHQEDDSSSSSISSSSNEDSEEEGEDKDDKDWGGRCHM
ncbi:mitotic deacetylase-associated SANT domain protein-like isoform X3 [Polyodon spathula]|uniref:mitotic deacetylase-associated SANT domain protein-like isoform X3 n=1 Tax=Polyodon spathula TaxID=7913 RepID=UPI001B7EF2B2|nr:mitotic deacetylase-associated SANT domain protein-like isoform X3 [Polyodon spathula]